MKKKYEKPQVYMEKFELSHNVAVCDYKLGPGDEKTCTIIKDNYADDGEDFTGGFLTEGACKTKVSIYCYTDGGGGLPKIFQS